VYGRSTAAPQLAQPLNSSDHPFFLPFHPTTLREKPHQICRRYRYFFISLLLYFGLFAYLFNLTAEVCSNDPTVLHPFSVFSNLCETSYPHPRTGQTQNLTFRPAA
jgi:hypothetical protein